jgi:HEAT repeat protein
VSDGIKDLLLELLSGDEARAEAAVPGLPAFDLQALPSLKEAAQSEDPEQRWWAVRAMAELPHLPGEELAPFLQDASEPVRQAAALGLAAHPNETLIPALILALYDKDPMVASLASHALIKAGAAAVPALLEALKEGPHPVRIQAVRALVELKDHRAIPAMMALMQEDSAVLGHWAEVGLERLGLNMVYIKPT